jgi:hypothetical protein
MISACGVVDLSRDVYVEPEFQAYVEDFQMQTGLKNIIPIKFKEIQEEYVIALCYNYNNTDKNYIEVDPEEFNKLSDSEKEETIYHELGHCLLNRSHNESMLDARRYGIRSSIPKTIMYPYVFGTKYLQYKGYYVNELVDETASLFDFL